MLVLVPCAVLLRPIGALTQLIGFLLLHRSLGVTASLSVDSSDSAMRLRLLGPKFRRLFEIAQRIGILPAFSHLVPELQDGKVKQIRSSRILRIEFVGVMKSLIRRKIFTELGQDNSV